MSEQLKQEVIDEWKKEHGKVYKTVISGKTYVYYGLKRNEFKELQKAISPDMNVAEHMSPVDASKLEDAIVGKCVLYPAIDNVDKLDAGAPAILSTLIANISGFNLDEEPQEL